MPSAPAGGARASPRRRALSASPARARRSPGRRLSAPARLGSSANPRYRRARSASPGVRHWSPPRRRTTTRARRGSSVGRGAKALTALVALQSALGAGGPYVGAPGKAVAVWPLGASGPSYSTLSKTYTVGPLAKFPVVERVRGRRPKTCGRKACLGGQPNSSLYEPKMTWVRLNRNGGRPRKLGEGAWANIPRPVISASDVLKFEAQGYQLPKKVLQQAHAGLPITGNYVPSNKTMAALARKDPRLLPALLKAQGPVPSRFNRPLELPPNVRRKLAALESRARTAGISRTAQALAAPWKVAAKARNLTGRTASALGRGISRSVAAAGQARRSLMRVLTAQERRLPN